MGVQERLSLEAVSAATVIASEHVHRYRLAARLCSGKRVLDLACGSGYGSAILRETASAVTGVDNDVATIDMATVTVGTEHDVSFEAADALEFLNRELLDDYDAIVCFEGLEHFADPDAVLERMAHHAAAGMRLVVSVPNSKAFEEENEFHVTDYGYEQTLAAFERFDEVSLLYQYLAEGSLITPTARPAESANVVLGNHAEKEWANHYIACVNLADELSAAQSSADMQFVLAPAYNRHLQNLERANRELWRENARMARAHIGMGDSAAVVLNGKLYEAYEHCERLQKRVDELEGTLALPRHRAVERTRDRLRALPGVENVLSALGRRLS